MYFGLEVVQEYACGESYSYCPSGPMLVREFVHGDPERYPEQVAMIDHYGTGRTENVPEGGFVYHYLHDALGSVIGLVDETGLPRERYAYDPYGRPFIEWWDENANGGQGAWVDNATSTTVWGAPSGGMPYSAFGNPFGFTGHRYDGAVGLYHTKYRSYEPVLGRWLQRDPIEYAAGSINLYEYCYSSPLTFRDPEGDTPAIVIPIVGGISAAEAVAGTFGLSLAACMATPSCRDAVYDSLRQGVLDTADSLSRAAGKARAIAEKLARARLRWLRAGNRKRGNCTPAEHGALQAAVTTACKGSSRSCDGLTDCKAILANAAKNTACLQARNAINTRCFGGGDAGHQRAADEASTAAFNCVKAAIANHCYKRNRRPGHGCNK